jgi:hypothetical protein
MISDSCIVEISILFIVRLYRTDHRLSILRRYISVDLVVDIPMMAPLAPYPEYTSESDGDDQSEDDDEFFLHTD